MDRAGLWARRQGPWQLLIVFAIRVMLTPRWRNFLNRTGPRFHCFQIVHRKRRRIHSSSAFSSEGV